MTETDTNGSFISGNVPIAGQVWLIKRGKFASSIFGSAEKRRPIQRKVFFKRNFVLNHE